MSTFRGVDPPALDELSLTIESRAAALSHRTAESYELLTGFGAEAVADRVATSLTKVARALHADSVELRRRADLVRYAEQMASVGVPLMVLDEARLAGEFALLAPLGIADWDGAYARWRDGPGIAELLALDPEAIADRFVGISSRARIRLVLEHPHVIGSMDGAPPGLRFAANRILVQRELARLGREATRLESALADLNAEGPGDVWVEARRDAARGELDHVRARIDRYQAWAREDRKLLLFDPSGDGRVAEVFGDLPAADHVAVVVPGITNDIANFGPAAGGGFRADGARLQVAASALNGSVATIAWLGYDTPDGADAVFRSSADAAHGDLVRFLGGLVAEGDRHITVIGHSYGSLVTGMAAAAGIPADEVVFVGSPGTSLDHAGDANLAPGGEVWAGLASWDLIGAGVDPFGDDAVEWSLSLPGRYIWDVVTGGDLAAEELWHGRNPAHESFGAVEFTTDGATGHSQYFDPGTASLENLARIVAGLSARVEILSSEPFEMAPGPFGRPGGEWIDPGWGGEVA